MRTRGLLLSAVVIGTACGDGGGPVRLVTGKWGGENIAVSAGTQRVTVAYLCATAQFTAAIAPDAAGDFTLRNGAVTQRGRAGTSVSVAGHIDGDQMTVVVSAGGLYKQETSYAAQRDAPTITTADCSAQQRGR